MPDSTVPPAASMRAVSPMRPASGLTCGLGAAGRARSGGGEEGGGGGGAGEEAGQLPHLDQAELRRREHHEVDLVDLMRIGGLERPDVVRGDVMGADLAIGDNVIEALRFRR